MLCIGKIKSKLLCPICEEGKLKEVIKKTCLEFSNPGQIVVKAKIRQCDKCGETFLDEKEAIPFARKVDKLLKETEKARKIKVREGDVLLI
ncbi:MAG: YgiT-type zinc finger protein [Candidatus Hodarchaeota archaeon]